MCCLFVCTQGQTHGQFGIAYAHNAGSDRHDYFCFMYNPLFKQLPRNQDDAVSRLYCIFCLDKVQNPPTFVTSNIIYVTPADQIRLCFSVSTVWKSRYFNNPFLAVIFAFYDKHRYDRNNVINNTMTVR